MNYWLQLHCCGLDSKTDTYVKNGTDGLLIRSCCRDTVNPCKVGNAYDMNCSEALADNLGSIFKIIGVVAIVFGVIEVRICETDSLRFVSSVFNEENHCHSFLHSLLPILVIAIIINFNKITFSYRIRFVIGLLYKYYRYLL